MDWLRKLLFGEETAYKVIRVSMDGAMMVSSSSFGMARVFYKEGKWASAPEWLAKQGHWLTCFSALHNAKAFEEEWGGLSHQIWKVRAKGITDALPPICRMDRLEIGHFERLRDTWWPPGTIMAKQIKLEERIE